MKHRGGMRALEFRPGVVGDVPGCAGTASFDTRVS